MAKFGYLYLQIGKWDGQQVVSPQWVNVAMQRSSDVDVDEHFVISLVTLIEKYPSIELTGFAILLGLTQILTLFVIVNVGSNQI
jgi:hypothetical protein